MSARPLCLYASPFATSELSGWYASHPNIRRLVAVELVDAECTRIQLQVQISIAIEPALDSSDTVTSWLGCGARWAGELRRMFDPQIAVAVTHFEGAIEGYAGGLAVIARLDWRDPTCDTPWAVAPSDGLMHKATQSFKAQHARPAQLASNADQYAQETAHDH